ncbi:hypothetical protein [Haladaptatus sp. T7]|uniref:hypothetical protein n=1 Tax=Haladaptatus sp. T7 TaxID=2029368 RepID=UPI002231BB3A|nr:hypothetical protein [Haladaptatus sp. T7]
MTADNFTIDNKEVFSIIEKTSISPEQVSQNGKRWFLNNLSNELTWQEYREFIDAMFREYGKEGSVFNQQLVHFPKNLETNGLYEKLKKYEENPLTEPFGAILTQPLFINQLEKQDNKIDVSFYTAVKFEEYESTEEIPIQVHDESGEKINELSPEQSVKVPMRRRVELRIYTNHKLMSISNSEIPGRLQKEIYNIVVALARDSPVIGGEDNV